MAFVRCRTGVLRAGLDQVEAGAEAQAVVELAGGVELQSAVYLVALLDEGEAFGRAVRAGELVGLADAIQCGGEAQRIAPCVLHAGLGLARQQRGTRGAAVGSPVRRSAAQQSGQASCRERV